MPSRVKVQDKARVAERRHRLAQLINEGVRPQRELAEILGVSDRTVRNDLVALDKEYTEMGASVVGKMRDRERTVSLMRLERYIQKLQSDIYDPDKNIQTIRLLKELEERRAKLLGLDAPTRIAPTDPTGEDEYSGIPEAAKRRMLGRFAQESGTYRTM